MAKKWYVLHTYSGYENKVKKNLEMRIEALGLDEADRARLFHGTALEWLGLPRHRFAPDPISEESA